MIREKISFTGHYKATSMDDDCVLTFQTPLTLETGDLAQKPIKAKIRALTISIRFGIRAWMK